MRSIKKLVAKSESDKRLKPDNLTNASGDAKPSKVKKNARKKLTCIIRLLDDSQPPLEFSVTKEDIGEHVFLFVCEKVGDIPEYDYFGLRYRDKFDQEQWLDLSRSVYKQLRWSKSPELCFRLKHYPADPNKDLKQEFTRYLVYLQIRRDLVNGRLACPPSMIGSVGALVIQAEFGDLPISNEKDAAKEAEISAAPVSECSGITTETTKNQDGQTCDVTPVGNYPKGFSIFCSQTEEDELAIMKKHQRLRGLTIQEAERQLLDRVSRLPTYGIVPFPVVPHHKIDTSEIGNSEELGNSDQLRRTQSSPIQKTDRKFNLGISGNGLVTFIGLKKAQEFSWTDIQRLGCSGKQFYVYLKKEESNSFRIFGRNKTRQFTFDCESEAAALALWRWAVDRKCFFTLKESKQAKRLRSNSSIFHRSQTYRFSGRSYQELTSIPVKNSQTHFVRVSSMRNSSRPDVLSQKIATLPGRLRPIADISEVQPTSEMGDSPLTESNKPAETINPVIVPDTVMDQPMEVASVHLTFPISDEQGLKETESPVVLETVETVVEPSIEVTKSLDQNSDPSELPTVAAKQDTIEIRKRLDSNLIHSVVYEEVISALDQTIDAHEGRITESTLHKTSGLLNGEISKMRPGETKNGFILQQSPEVNMSDDDMACSKEFNKPVSLRTKTTVTTVVVVVLIGIIFALETTPKADFSVTRFLRSNYFVSGFESYVYHPVRNLIVSGLSLIWP